MNLKNVMEYSNFVVVGNTLLEEKYAYKIKHQLINHGYNVESVGKELVSINDVKNEIDVLVLCIHPALGIKLLEENSKDVKAVVVQPGAESKEVLAFLNANNYQFIEACVLVGLKLYSK